MESKESRGPWFESTGTWMSDWITSYLMWTASWYEHRLILVLFKMPRGHSSPLALPSFNSWKGCIAAFRHSSRCHAVEVTCTQHETMIKDYISDL